jgi:hypothetical protein
VLIRPEPESRQVADLATRTRDVVERLDMHHVKTFRASRGAVVGEPWQPPVQFLDPTDAHQLYGLLHRWRLMVVCFTSVFVRKNPRRQPAVRRSALELRSFVEHKADFALIRSGNSIASVIEAFRNERRLSCEGEDDPRCLPLHVFALDKEWSNLGDKSGRDAFNEHHGPPRSRLDSDDRRWSRAARSAYHGRDKLTVASCDLTPGMHWDVASERGRAQLMTAHEIWELPRGSRGYLNVYPDAYVRPGARSRARRIWPTKHEGQRT